MNVTTNWSRFDLRDAKSRCSKNPYPKAEYCVGKAADEAYAAQQRTLARLTAERLEREASAKKV